MREESLRVQVEGHLLHRLVMHPAEGLPVCAEALFYHGQGDYAERYLDVLHPFTRRGIRCTITELPGHGRSPGKRGHCGDVHLLDAVIQDTLGSIDKRGGLPYGVAGHSMGGLLALRHLVLAGQGKFPVPDFAWLSSPLIEPGLGRPAFFLKWVQFLVPLIPSLTFSTRVKPEDCCANPEDAEGQELGHAERVKAPQNPLKGQLAHKQISLGWGAALLDAAKLIRDAAGDIPPAMPLLLTQGGADPVCPPELAREIFALLPNTSKRYEEFESILHEPFSGEGGERLYAVLDDWLESLALSGLPD